MSRTYAKSLAAQKAYSLCESLQQRFVRQLSNIADTPNLFTNVDWLRDDGQHGGGNRFEAGSDIHLNRASVNVSQVHYDDLPDKSLASATALSAIIHPQHPLSPSIHLHISWTEMRGSSGYWRFMADLNPAIKNDDDEQAFRNMCKHVLGDRLYKDACEQGDRYFYIPSLDRHRGVAHMYLENHQGGDANEDLALARRFGEGAIDHYCKLLQVQLANQSPAEMAEKNTQQLAYHTLYAFQVLTLDRGTTAGLLIHDQNDLGVLGSLPARIDLDLLGQWLKKVPNEQKPLVDGIIEVLQTGHTNSSVVEINPEHKRQLAQWIRNFYQTNPDVLRFQASGGKLPMSRSERSSER